MIYYMNLATRIAFRLKNFRHHMRITDNASLAGLIRRFARRHPRATALAKGATVLGGVYFLMMSLLPGTSLPLQSNAKLSLLALYSSLHAAPGSQPRPGTTTSSVPTRSSTSSGSTRSRWPPSTRSCSSRASCAECCERCGRW